MTDIEKLILSAVHIGLADGGHTVSFLPDPPRYVVGDGSQGFVVPVDEFDSGDPRIARLAKIASENYEGVGVWVHDGDLYIDPVTFHAYFHDANQVAWEREEMMFYDLLKDEAHDTERPYEPAPEDPPMWEDHLGLEDIHSYHR